MVFRTKENKFLKFTDVKIRGHPCPRLNADPYLDRKILSEEERTQEEMNTMDPDPINIVLLCAAALNWVAVYASPMC